MSSQPNGADPTPRRHRGWKRIVGFSALGLLVLFGLAQLVPFGHSYVPFGHPTGNPPVTKAAVWTDPQAQALAEHACYDCHSNLTKWWLGTNVAPMSWLAQSDVNGGREILNFSEWDKPQAGLDDVTESVQGGGMPPLQYKLAHSNARLSASERQQLVNGLRQLYATDPPAGVKQGGG